MYKFLTNEVALFLKFSNLEPLTGPGLSALLHLEHGANSIQRLTQDFLSSLQFGGFPSTTMAILRLVLLICLHFCALRFPALQAAYIFVQSGIQLLFLFASVPLRRLYQIITVLVVAALFAM